MYYGHYSKRSARSAARRWITARYDSTCPDTGKPIHKGTECLYDPVTRKAYHESSDTARDQRGSDFAEANNMPDANW